MIYCKYIEIIKIRKDMNSDRVKKSTCIFFYLKKHIIQSNEHKKYVKLSHMFKRIIGSEYPIHIQDVNNYSSI